MSMPNQRMAVFLEDSDDTSTSRIIDSYTGAIIGTVGGLEPSGAGCAGQ